MSTDATPTNETVDSPPLMLASGVVLNDRWRMHRCLASGGYGDVWSAQDLENDETEVAIKILRTDAGNNDPSAMARMRQEAEILVRLDHPNIVHVYGFYESAYGEFLVMELLQGLALDQSIIKEGPAAGERAFAVTVQLLGALGAAHDQNILHRDIKPENIILMPSENGEQAKLLDFGIAKAQSPFGGEDESGVTLVQTRAGGFMGTPRYTAPEQAVGDPIGPSADLFALGLVIAEWLTGKMRMDGERHADLMSQLLSPDPVDISDTPERWHKWLAKMVAKEPTQRFQTAAEAIQAFEDWVINATKRPDFLDDGYFHGGEEQQASAFADSLNGPLELDLDRVRQMEEPAAAPQAPSTGPMATPPAGPAPAAARQRPANLQRPNRRPQSTQDIRGNQQESNWPEMALAVAAFICAIIVAYWVFRYLDRLGILPTGIP